ncbi:inverse autotransporter beta domain-containing protein [Serratia symbiotica]|uniref:inverse autotransporter beta domain-containing protein n=1 Tax=Serratia symbiotica TaxID=138074 RepID=UPI0020902CB0|nr:inverse autotransporter beta domain-containing protein [Serratia symbiotica]USS95934.1 inverse autotransporter beta domain-containing protein [Serratia symbiotica]
MRTFAHGFDHLQPGDELNVPIAPLPQVQWHDEPAVAPAADDPAQRVAGVASQAGSFLANHPNGEAAAAMAPGMATGAASGQLQQWLRHFAPRYMLGANFFTDYDLSRDHARIGLGVEYWRDFLKLSANGYQHLTGWRDAPELTDYEARPANGWDIRAQAWLPALPQLGGRLSYEEYHGDEVALFGKDQRQRSPYAFAGIEYTPVPLLAFSVAQHQGKSRENDTRLGVEMRYQLGMP